MFKIKLRKNRKPGVARDQNGFTLLEAVIGIALLSAVVVAVLVGVSTSFKADALADSQSTAISIAQRQVEYLQSGFEDYHTAPTGGEATYTKITDIPDNYSIWSYNRTELVSNVVGVPWSSAIDGSAGSPVSADGGLQRIKLVIKQGNREIYTVEIYLVE
ncbi:MAG TPA: prepilin-type N-terminal cleavage/methylation domain-containing protein [Dehalococcoidales bacterium]